MAQNVFGIDIGTSNIKIYNKATDEILNEKNIIAISNKKDVYAYGDEAYEMYEKAPNNIEVSYPIRYGVIADIQNMQTLLAKFIKKVKTNKSLIQSADFCIAVPTDITEVEKRAFYELILSSKVSAKKITVVEKPVADGVGVGIDINSPKGNMIVNVGADTTEITVLSLGGIVISKLIKTGGNRLDEMICSYVRKKYNLIIGEKTGEILKRELASGMEEEESAYKVYGRDLVSGLPVEKEISSATVYHATVEALHSIVTDVKLILERTPPELAADIIDTGIFLTGGSSYIRNFSKLISLETDLKVNIPDNPSECVVRGIAKILSTPEYLELTYVPREKTII